MAENLTFPQAFRELYGKSIYQVELEIATNLFIHGATVNQAWDKADEFSHFVEERYVGGALY